MNNETRILTIITTSFVPYGGLATVVLNYYRYLDRDKFHMDFASSNAIDIVLRNELIANGSTYYRLSHRGNILRHMYELQKIAKDYDVVHIHSNSATAVLELMPTKLAGVSKRVLHIHNTTCNHKVIHKMLHPLMAKLSTNNLAYSKLAGEWIFKEYTILNKAIDLNKYEFDANKRDIVRREYGIEKGTFVIGHVGKFAKQKNHRFLIELFKK